MIPAGGGARKAESRESCSRSVAHSGTLYAVCTFATLAYRLTTVKIDGPGAAPHLHHGAHSATVLEGTLKAAQIPARERKRACDSF